MSNELEDIRKRLASAEEAISELRREDLSTTKVIGKTFCTTQYNIGVFTQKGEALEKYKELWKKKLKATKKELEASQTIEKVFEIAYKFESELFEYIKATKVDTADKAMEIAHLFIKKYSPVALPLKAEREGDVWLVDIDVGALAVKVAKVKVDARTGDILSYNIPEKK